MDPVLLTPLGKLSAALLSGVLLGLYAGSGRRLAWGLLLCVPTLLWLEHLGWIVLHEEVIVNWLGDALHADGLSALLALLGVRFGLSR